MNDTVTMNGGQLAARTLREAGVEVVFGIHGGHLDSFLMGCAEQGIRVIDCRHEAAAINAADGYARSGGGIGVAFVTSGPGLTNGLAGITNAAADDVPLVVITSSSPIREVETRELQGGLDLIAMLGPVTRWSRKVLAAQRTPDMVALGIRQAFAKRGPVVIDIPIDVAFTPVDVASLPRHGKPEVGAGASAPAEAIDAAARLLEAAARPVVIVGEGGLVENFREELREFAEATGVPVFTTGIAPYGLPRDHALSGGSTMSLGFLAQRPDLVLLVGARQGMFTGGRSGGSVPADARIIQIDGDAAEVGRLYPVDQALIGACGPTLRNLAQSGNWPARADWARAATALPSLGNALFPNAPEKDADGIHPHRAGSAIVRALPEDAILVYDGGEAPLWVSGALGRQRIHTQLSLGYQGHLGSGQGYAMGAQVAHPDRRVIQIAGDGAIAFHIQEWDTMVRHCLPVVTIIFNNACWGMSIHGQHAVYGADRDVATRLAPTAYEKVAEGFGAHGERVDELAELPGAIERALASGKPAVINVRTSGEVVHPVTTMLLGDVNAADQIVVPYYQNLPK